MSSIITAVFKATIGLIVNKGRDSAAERLKDGDVADQKFRGVIVREIEDIKTKLDSLARMYLLAAIDAFETGLGYLYQAIDAEAGEAGTSQEKHLKEISSPPTAAAKTVALAAEMKRIKLTECSNKTKQALSQAKERFKMAREEATRAFNNEALSTFNRVTAIRYRVMATMLGSAVETVATASDLSTLSVENALTNALPECEQCLHKLNSLPDVQNNFKVELEKGLLNIKGRFGKDERRQIISSVCQINRAIFEAKETLSKDLDIWILPLIDTGEDMVDPLRDGRVSKVLERVGTECSCVRPLSFGQEGQEENRLRRPVGIATNSDGQFIVADAGDKNIKVFDSSGNFLRSFNSFINHANNHVSIQDVATDENSNIYVLVANVKQWNENTELEVQVFDSTGEVLLRFPAGILNLDLARMAVTNNKVLVLRRDTGDRIVVDVYDHGGGFVLRFGEEILTSIVDITAGNDGRIMIMGGVFDHSMYVFTDDSKNLSKFHMNTEEYIPHALRIGCHPEGEHFVVGGKEESSKLCSVSIYTKDFKFVRKITLLEYKINYLKAITVTRKGHIAVIAVDGNLHGRIIVI